MEKAKVNCSLLREEWSEMVDYTKRYLNLVQVEYQVLWWKFFNAVDAQKLTNVLSLVESQWPMVLLRGSFLS